VMGASRWLAPKAGTRKVSVAVISIAGRSFACRRTFIVHPFYFCFGYVQPGINRYEEPSEIGSPVPQKTFRDGEGGKKV
jgi:hypothetical protein